MSADRYSVWTRQKTTLFSGHYLRNHSTLDIAVLDYIGILYHKEQPPEAWHIPPGTTCIYRVRQRKRMVFDWLILDKEKDRDFRLLLVDSLDCAVSEAMAPWTLENRVFVFETHIET
jgi:hypothetical protein